MGGNEHFRIRVCERERQGRLLRDALGQATLRCGLVIECLSSFARFLFCFVFFVNGSIRKPAAKQLSVLIKENEWHDRDGLYSIVTERSIGLLSKITRDQAKEFIFIEGYNFLNDPHLNIVKTKSCTCCIGAAVCTLPRRGASPCFYKAVLTHGYSWKVLMCYSLHSRH